MVNIGIMAGQLFAFGRLMHRIVETVAKQARLVPLDVARQASPRLAEPYKIANSAASRRTPETPLVRG